MFEALRKLPQKYADFFGDIPEYTEYQPVFNQAIRENPVFVVVVSGGVEMMPELVGEYLRINGGHFLNTYEYPVCIIDLVDFEYSVEVAATGQKNLSELLADYWVSASGFFAGRTPVQNLYGFNINRNESFSNALGRRLLEDIREEAAT